MTRPIQVEQAGSVESHSEVEQAAARSVDVDCAGAQLAVADTPWRPLSGGGAGLGYAIQRDQVVERVVLSERAVVAGQRLEVVQCSVWQERERGFGEGRARAPG